MRPVSACVRITGWSTGGRARRWASDNGSSPCRRVREKSRLWTARNPSRRAFHAGLDFKGPIGAPIFAAAKGTVSFAGQKQGYGNCLEIDHGNGLMTRYAHMSAFRARVGQPVKAGDLVGAIGSSGRSTGPHLHFEVRINDRPVNPRPFLEAAPHVLEEARTGRPGGHR